MADDIQVSFSAEETIEVSFDGAAGVPASTAANDFLVGNGSAFVKKTLAETKTALGITDYDFTIIDGATPAVNLLSSKSGITDWTSAQTASAPVFSNLPTKGVRNFTIKKTNAADLVITFALANTVFRFFDSTNKCFTIGTNCTLVSSTANTTFELSLEFTGLTNASGYPIIHVAGTYNAFA